MKRPGLFIVVWFAAVAAQWLHLPYGIPYILWIVGGSWLFAIIAGLIVDPIHRELAAIRILLERNDSHLVELNDRNRTQDEISRQRRNWPSSFYSEMTLDQQAVEIAAHAHRLRWEQEREHSL